MKWMLLVAVVALGAVLVLAVDRGPAGDARVQQVHDAVSWPDSCADVVIHERSSRSPWSAPVNVLIECQHLGPAVRYARFASEAQLRTDLLAETPSAPVCVFGDEVLVDILDPGQFEPLCRRFDGDLIDAVSELPEIVASESTIAEIDRTGDAQQRRDAAAQARALRRYWHIG